MEREVSGIGLQRLCGLFGVTRQAWYERRRRACRAAIEEALVVEMVSRWRKKGHAKMGGCKMYVCLKPDLEKMGLKMGRDAFLDVLRHHGLLMPKKRRRMQKTTDSRHWFRCYLNLVAELEITGPEQVWVSDITYIRLQDGFCYLSLITDAYSRKIVGWHVSETLEASGCVTALKMALRNRKTRGQLIHHSDRGIQYCAHEYVGRLKKAGILISMTQSGSGENAIAERINGILKDEYLLAATFGTLQEVRKQMTQTVRLYNEERPHMSIDMLTPEQAHQSIGVLRRRWRAPERQRERREVHQPKDIHSYPHIST
jgi:putative transposase